MTAVVLLSLALGSDWHIGGTGYFKAIPRRYFQVTPWGEFLLLNPEARYLARFSADGQRLENIGRPGQGPGEFSMPFDVFCEGENIYLHEFWLGKVLVYGRDGTYLETIQQPAFGIRLYRISNGWMYFQTGGLQTEQSRLVRTDADFENAKVLLAWPVNRKSATSFNPFLDIFILARSGSKENYFCYRPGIFRIDSVNPFTSETEPFFESDAPPIAVEPAHIAAWKKDPDRDRSSAFPVSFPDHFPPIKDMFWTPTGHLCVIRGAPPGTNIPVLLLSAHGEPEKRPWDAGALASFLGAWDGWAYFSDAGGEETAIVRIPAADFESRVMQASPGGR